MRRFLIPLSAAILAALGSAGGSGLLIADAAAQIARRPEDDKEAAPPLVLAVADAQPMEMLAHRSHSSHSSHRSHASHRSHYSGSGGGSGGGASEPSPTPPPPPPPPPKPAVVSFVAFPGGRISIDGTSMGSDTTQTMYLKPGRHQVRIENRFLGEHATTVALDDGQTGVVTIEW